MCYRRRNIRSFHFLFHKKIQSQNLSNSLLKKPNWRSNVDQISLKLPILNRPQISSSIPSNNRYTRHSPHNRSSNGLNRCLHHKQFPIKHRFQKTTETSNPKSQQSSKLHKTSNRPFLTENSDLKHLQKKR